MKQDFPCIRFLSAGEIVPVSPWFIYSGMRWQLTYALPIFTAPNHMGWPLCCGKGDGDFVTSVYSSGASFFTDRREVWLARAGLSSAKT